MEDANLSIAMYGIYAFTIWIQVEYAVDYWKKACQRRRDGSARAAQVEASPLFCSPADVGSPDIPELNHPSTAKSIRSRLS